MFTVLFLLLSLCLGTLISVLLLLYPEHWLFQSDNGKRNVFLAMLLLASITVFSVFMMR